MTNNTTSDPGSLPDALVLYGLYAYFTFAAFAVLYMSACIAERLSAVFMHVAAICSIVSFTCLLLQDDAFYSIAVATPIGQLMAHPTIQLYFALARQFLVGSSFAYSYNSVFSLIRKLMTN